jgi:hypothetical protein
MRVGGLILVKKKKEDNFDVDRFLLKRGILLRFSELPSH